MSRCADNGRTRQIRGSTQFYIHTTNWSIKQGILLELSTLTEVQEFPMSNFDSPHDDHIGEKI
jgi:hypothetical protein